MREQIRSDLAAAARRLNVELISPYCLEHDGRVAWCLGYLPHFGSANGMVVDMVCLDAQEFAQEVMHLAQRKGVHYSLLHPDTYLEPSEKDFVEAFADWGYFGPPEKKPRWL
jgi:hypothetical protein